MLNENIKICRRAKGLSQEELAAKLNVVRQTVSKWENGLSVPDADLLIRLSRELDVPVSRLLGEKTAQAPAEDLKAIAEKLEVVNLQLAQSKTRREKMLRTLVFVLAGGTTAIFLFLAFYLKGGYLSWDLTDPETAVVATFLHSFEWLFIRLLPFAVTGLTLAIFYILRKNRD